MDIGPDTAVSTELIEQPANSVASSWVLIILQTVLSQLPEQICGCLAKGSASDDVLSWLVFDLGYRYVRGWEVRRHLSHQHKAAAKVQAFWRMCLLQRGVVALDSMGASSQASTLEL